RVLERYAFEAPDERHDDLALRRRGGIRTGEQPEVVGGALALAGGETTNEVDMTAMEVGGVLVGRGAQRAEADDVPQHAPEVVQRLPRAQQLHPVLGATGFS